MLEDLHSELDDAVVFTLMHALALYNRNVPLVERVRELRAEMAYQCLAERDIQETIIEHPDAFLAELPGSHVVPYVKCAWRRYQNEAFARWLARQGA